MPSVSVLGAARIAQRLVTIVASRRRALEISVLVANPTQPLGAVEQVDHLLQGEVDGQLFDGT